MRRVPLSLVAMALALVAISGSFSSSANCSSRALDLIESSIVQPPTLKGQAPQVRQTSPDAFYREVWELVRDNFLWQQRLGKWGAWEHKFDGKLHNVEDAEKAINEALSSLGDGYTYLRDASVTRAHDRRYDVAHVVTSELLRNRIGYIRIRTFSSCNTASEFKAAIWALSKCDAYVIDLRDNGGGYLYQAWHVFGMLADRGELITLKGIRHRKLYQETFLVDLKGLEDIDNGFITTSTREPNLSGGKPIVVLINRDTASSAEMLSGALRDNGRAVLVGTRTFGKGIAQMSWRLPYGTSVQITFAQYFLPKGECVECSGISPDQVVTEDPKQGKDAQLLEALRILHLKLGK